MTDCQFVILKEDHDDFSQLTRVARPLTLAEAKATVVALAMQYPQQRFHVFADCGAADYKESVRLELRAPNLSSHGPEALSSITALKSGSR